MTEFWINLRNESVKTGFEVAGMILPSAPSERFTVYLLNGISEIRPVVVRVAGEDVRAHLAPDSYPTTGRADEWTRSV
jgi:hypothetical protein